MSFPTLLMQRLRQIQVGDLEQEFNAGANSGGNITESLLLMFYWQLIASAWAK